MGLPPLPSPNPRDEDAWVLQLQDLEHEQLVDLVKAAVQAGRPQLAGRVVGLILPESDEDPELKRARKAARLLLLQGPGAWQELSELLQSLRAKIVLRSKRRHRDMVKNLGTGKSPFSKPGSSRRRRR